MTATLGVNESIIQTYVPYYDGGDTFDLGTVESEVVNIDNGVEVISTSNETSEQNMTFNIQGQKVSIDIVAKKTGVRDTNILNDEILQFTKNLKALSDFTQKAITVDTTFTYTNTDSKYYFCRSGVKMKIGNIKLIDSNQESPNTIKYTLRLIQSKSLF